MEFHSAETSRTQALGPVLLSPTATVILASSLGLIGGYFDIVLIAFKKYYINELRYFWSGSDFPWSVPVAHAGLLATIGVLVALVNLVRPGRTMTLLAAARILATIALWFALLRLPIFGICSLMLAAGLARPVGAAASYCSWNLKRARYTIATLLTVLIILATLSSGRQAYRHYVAVNSLPAPPKAARNVILIVLDTVRAASLSLYGYERDTTPQLRKWARNGVRFALALAPAPWTYPSHSSFFTGQWPYKLDSQWNFSLDTKYPTLAEYLASRGYQTVGFVANTRGCSYETGLDRGFATYEDYPLTVRHFFGRTVPGNWILQKIIARGDYCRSKWTDLQSRDAREINDAFLDWLAQRNSGRPFFAFLNYFDAHSPYVPPADYAGRFGSPPKLPEDYELLFDFPRLAQSKEWRRNFLMARDRYDDCLASLDTQVGNLLDSISKQRLLENTVVIITSDHGESFGDHRVFGHGGALYLDQTAVPLVILDPDAPPGRTITSPVSLRDLPATIVDRLALSEGSPFPGQTLAGLWASSPATIDPPVTPALSEMAQAAALRLKPGERPARAGMQMSLVANGWHYIRDRVGPEQVYDLRRDPSELINVADSPDISSILFDFRRTLLDILTQERGSTEVENAYLSRYRRSLEADLRTQSSLFFSLSSDPSR